MAAMGAISLSDRPREQAGADDWLSKPDAKARLELVVGVIAVVMVGGLVFTQVTKPTSPTTSAPASEPTANDREPPVERMSRDEFAAHVNDTMEAVTGRLEVIDNAINSRDLDALYITADRLQLMQTDLDWQREHAAEIVGGCSARLPRPIRT